MGKRRQRRLERQMMQATETQMQEQQEKLNVQRETLDQQKKEYKEFTFQNPYADVENFYEDIQVDTQAAEFQMEQAAQQRANILSSLRGAAGASGIGGLAQALANQATMQARQVSVDIARQERQGQMLARRGAEQADMLRRQGEAAVQQAEFGRESTPRAHRLFKVLDLKAKDTRKYFDYKDPAQPKKAMLVEVRANKHYTMCWGQYDNGEKVTWTKHGDPTEITWDALNKACALLSVAAVILRKYPVSGTHDEYLRLIVNTLWHHKVTKEDCTSIL